jgi:hypothetical protein
MIGARAGHGRIGADRLDHLRPIHRVQVKIDQYQVRVVTQQHPQALGRVPGGFDVADLEHAQDGRHQPQHVGAVVDDHDAKLADRFRRDRFRHPRLPTPVL